MEMVGSRSKSIQRQTESYQKKTANQFYAEPKYREILNDIVNDMKLLIEKNKFIETTFKEVQQEVVKIGDIESFLSRLDEFDNLVSL